MGRPKRVLSFMSQWGGTSHLQKQPPSSAASPSPRSPAAKPPSSAATAQSAAAPGSNNTHRATPPVSQHARSDSIQSSRPYSMIQTYQPPIMDVGHDTLPELQRIFTFLNSHSNKLYQEGYFLKFHDTDARGRPAPDRKWQEYFVQLVGTILSLWDASELDRAGGETEVLPTFINLTDAALHMIPSMTLKDGKKLDNVLSVSTAASNKYLFHFDSYHALTQWTAGIRLAMYEHTCLSEAYTGALIAGKGKSLNNIRTILDRQYAIYDDWVRVRFGAGTPWRRCWCVVSPPDQKEYTKLQKSLKKTSAYDKPPALKGDIKFYDTKKIKKSTRPIATIKDAFACYAIYPQSKHLIDQSTLVKIEGKITIHSSPESTTEGFVFVMPEARPAITGFEIMLQYLFPVFDTFNLYGRPKKLVADVLDTRGLMFGMPSDKRYGYLEIWDVVNLINTDGSQAWPERQWRKALKNLTSTRMSATSEDGPDSTRSSRRNTVSRAGVTSSRSNLRFSDQGPVHSSPSTRRSSPARQARFDDDSQPHRVGTAPPPGSFATPRHQRSVSEAHGYSKYQSIPSHLRKEAPDSVDFLPTPPEHGVNNEASPSQQQYRDISDSDESPSHEARNLPELPLAPSAPPYGPVDAPPALSHAPYQQPPIRPSLPSAMKPNAAVDTATLQQIADVSNTPLSANLAAAGAAAAWKSQENIHSGRSGEYSAQVEQGKQMHRSSNAPMPLTERPSDNRLPTIPASPYVEHSEFVQPGNIVQPTAPPVPEHKELLQYQSTQEFSIHPHPGSGSVNMQRKPVPGRFPPTSKEDDTHSTTSSDLGSLRSKVVDPDALEALNKEEATRFSNLRDDETLSSSTPDYASVASDEIQGRKLPERREDRPRSGILKIAGDPNIRLTEDFRHSPVNKAEKSSIEIPEIDFGRTYELDVRRPGTSGTMTQAHHDGHLPRPQENFATTPTDERRLSHISRAPGANATTHMRMSSNAQNASDSRSLPWGPSASSPQHQSDKQTFDADQWVQNRAAQQPPPLMYSHARTNSRTPPPFGRQRSGDWSHLPHSPDGSPRLARPPSRPISRQSWGTDALLDQRPHSLSAREQEQIARLTNTSLLSGVASHKQQQPSHGLTKYIDSREKEKAAAKANRFGHSTTMQAEIDRRLLQKQQEQMFEVQKRQRQILDMQQQQMQANFAQSAYSYGDPYHSSAPSRSPSVLGMSTSAPSAMGMPTGPGTPQGLIGMAYSTPQSMLQQQSYFQQQAMTPNTNQMPGGWGSPSAQSPQDQYFHQQQQQMHYGQQRMSYIQQQQPATQPYGASFDLAQAAARHAQQSGPPYR